MTDDRPWPRTWVLFLLATFSTLVFGMALELFQQAENVTPAVRHDQVVVTWLLGGASLAAWLAWALGLLGRALFATFGFVLWLGFVVAIPAYGYLT